MVPVLVINLARSPERWDAIRQTATGLELRRVEGVDGRAIARERWSGVDAYGRCLFGPLGSAACYAVNRSGAERLVKTLATMWLPWDVALERGWATGVATYTTREPLVAFSTHRASSTITASYAPTKLPTMQRRGAFSFRARDFLRRASYALEAA
jgi:glycosyl transferase family 25